MAQTFQFVHTGNAKLALVAHAQVIHAQVKGKTFAGGVWQVPSHMHKPIAQQLVVLKASNNLPSAKRFASWLLAAKQQRRIAAAGYAINGKAGR